MLVSGERVFHVITRREKLFHAIEPLRLSKLGENPPFKIDFGIGSEVAVPVDKNSQIMSHISDQLC